jgi:hypothetical protein
MKLPKQQQNRDLNLKRFESQYKIQKSSLNHAIEPAEFKTIQYLKNHFANPGGG